MKKFYKYLVIFIIIFVLFFNCHKNSWPLTPSPPSGTSLGTINDTLPFKASTTDPEGDNITYQFDWETEIDSNWSNFLNSGDSITVTHSWNDTGHYNIRVRAMDIKDKVSRWSDPHLLVIVISTTPNIPSVLSGPDSGYINYSYTFSTTTTDPNGDSISYQFDWGDDSLSPWSSYVPSGDSVQMDHSWSSEGTYNIKANAKDKYGLESGWSPEHSIIISIVPNLPPDVPDTPSGPSSGYVDSTYTFSATTTDMDGDSIAYQFDWGDNNLSGWSNYVSSGQSVSISHSYLSAGTYYVRAKAKDEDGAESGWSDGHQTVISSSSEYPDRVIKTVPVGDSPQKFDFLPNGEYAYITNSNSDNISVIKTSDHTVIESIPLGSRPVSAAALPSGEYVYIADQLDSCAYVIRTSDNTVTDTIKLGGGPHSIVSLPNGEYMYATNSWTAEVSVIRTSDNTVVASIPVGNDPRGLTELPNGEYVYVGCMGPDRIYVIRTSDNTVVDSIQVPRYPAILTSHPNGNYVYATRDFGNVIYVIETSTNTLINSIPVGDEPKGIAVLPTGDYIYVSNRGSNSISIIREADNTVVKTIPVSNAPLHIKSAPNGEFLYVTHGQSDIVTVIGY